MSVQELASGSVQERLFTIVAAQLQTDRASLHRDQLLTTLGADSLDLVGVVVEAEDAFEVSISDEQWAGLRTLGDLADVIERHRHSGETRAAEPEPGPMTGGLLRWLIRFGLLVWTRTLYRLRILGREHVPETGGALLVPNHVTFVDSLFLQGSLQRPVRFLVEASYFHKPLLHPFLKALGAIPITTSGGPRDILRALRAAGGCLDRGELVCIFPEGQLTRTGMMVPFRRGVERILMGRQAPVVPVYLDRAWGSLFSRSGGRFFFKWPAHLPYPVTVSFGAPLPPTTRVPRLRQAVHNLSETAWTIRKADRPPLHHTFVHAARWHPLRFAMADAAHPRLRRIEALAAAVALARALRPRWRDQPYVGILLPPSVPGALVNLAVALAGKTAVNLNHTAGCEGLLAAIRQAGLRTVVTSKEYLKKAKVELPEGIEVIHAEELKASIGFFSRMGALLLALFAPLRWLERSCGAKRRPQVDDIVTTIFSSGSTGEPKGVLLSHFNIDSNVEAVAQVFQMRPDDRLLGILPLFHSFGYLSLWFALNHGVGIVFHPNPLDARAIGDLTERYAATILLATPTFLQMYRRRVAPAQFGSLRIVMAGAEKLLPQMAQDFEDHFGIRPLEGFGMTECAPVVAASGLDFRAAGFYQPGSRRGSVGLPLPGVAVRVVDEQTFEPKPPGEEGHLLVKGPNVMRGYLNSEKLTAESFHDGWYLTGDLAALDDDGFLRITGRLSRTAKIGGEKISLGRVEEALHEAAGACEQVFAVAALPDEQKGERLAVLHTLDETMIPEVLERMAHSGLSPLAIPRPSQFARVEQLPLLGTGKLDLREVKRIAAEKLGQTD